MKEKKTSIFLKRNFQIIYAVILIILIPLTIVLNTIWSVKSFKHNIDIELQRQAVLIGQLFDASVFKETENLVDLQAKVQAIGQATEEITTFNILIPEGENFKIISSLEEDKLGTIDDGLNNIIAWHQNEAIATLVTDLNKNELPESECLKDTVDRFLPYWHETIAPSIQSGKKVLIVAHGNSLRALVKYLDDISDKEIVGLNIPTGVPLVYELDDQLSPMKHYYLGDQDAIAKKTAAIVAQGKLK